MFKFLGIELGTDFDPVELEQNNLGGLIGAPWNA